MLQQATTRAAPFMWEFVAFAQVASGTRNNKILRSIRTIAGKRDNVIDVPFRQFLMTPVALAFLTLILTTNISNGKRASSSLFPCTPVIAARPAKFRRLLRVGIPIVPMVRPYLLAVSFYISPLFLGMGAFVFSDPAPVLFRMAFAICLSACLISVKVLQFLLAMIGSKFFKMGFSIESTAIFTFRTQSIPAISLMRVKILQGSWLLLLTLWAVLVFLRSRPMPLNVRLRLSRRLFATLSRLAKFAVTCQAVFLAFIIVEVLKSGRKIVIALRASFQGYNIVHGTSPSSYVSSRLWSTASARRGNMYFYASNYSTKRLYKQA